LGKRIGRLGRRRGSKHKEDCKEEEEEAKHKEDCKEEQEED
jgi:ribosomal protein L37AE/L43A